MNNISYNWVDKTSRAIEAQEHTKIMELSFESEIEKSILNSTIIRNIDLVELEGNPEIMVVPSDSVSAALDLKNGKTTILNFASYKNPGGRFIDGSRAQEECLCHASFLYNVLREFPEYYDENKKDLNKGLYRNAAIYSPDITFTGKVMSAAFDVLTCASPNKTAAQKYQKVSSKENSEVLEDRIKFVVSILTNYKPDTAILGAFGCGVFGQDPFEVARLFKKYIPYLGDMKVVFAIPDETSANYIAFRKTFKEN